MRYPSIRDVASEVRDISANVEGGIRIHLKVIDRTHWTLTVGKGKSFIPGVVRGKVMKFNSYEVARSLLIQAKGTM